MRATLALAGVLAGLVAGLAPAPATAQCVEVVGLPGCVPTCPSGAYHYLDRETGGALPGLPGPLHLDCTL